MFLPQIAAVARRKRCINGTPQRVRNLTNESEHRQHNGREPDRWRRTRSNVTDERAYLRTRDDIATCGSRGVAIGATAAFN